MGDDLFKVVPIYEDAFAEIAEKIIFLSDKLDESISDTNLKINLVSGELHELAAITIKDSREKIQDSFIAILKDVEIKHEALLSEISVIKVSFDIMKSNIRCIENSLVDLTFDVNKAQSKLEESEFIKVYNIDNIQDVQKMYDDISILKNEIELLKKKKGFFKRLFGK